jgi:predicted phage terminase large subunit-like protein
MLADSLDLGAVEASLNAELERRRAAQSLISFTEQTFARYQTAEHHRTIAGQLERVERGEIDRLMLLVPPRHGKSELASKRFPAWLLGRQPHKQFLSISATAELAADFGREVRNLIGSPEYQAIFPTTLSEDSQAKGKWHTAAGGIYYSLGVGGSVLGRGGDCILIDDPFGSMREAQSELERKNVWDFYSGSVYNRLMPGGSIIVINHRMHEDDLCGRLLAQQAAGGDRWEVVELPAINEAGEALWPEAYPIEALDRIRRNTMPRDWSALYLQNPTVEDGDYFQREWLKPCVKLPDKATMRVYGASDYAVTSNGGDWTVHVVVGVDPSGRMYLLDLWRRQAASDVWVEAFVDLVQQWKPIAWAEETGQIKSGVGPFIEKRQRERRAYCYREQFPTRGDKAIRAQSIRGRMALDGLYYQANAPWFANLQNELLAFPNGKHDDQVDALGLAGQLLDKMQNGLVPVTEEPKRDRLEYVVGADGRVRSNLSVFEIVQAKMRRKARD